MNTSPPLPFDFILHPNTEANSSAEEVALVVKWHPVCSMNLDLQGGQTCGNLPNFFSSTRTQNQKQSEFNTYLKYSGYLTVGIDMVRKKKN